jgi:hypothetical protein
MHIVLLISFETTPQPARIEFHSAKLTLTVDVFRSHNVQSHRSQQDTILFYS